MAKEVAPSLQDHRPSCVSDKERKASDFCWDNSSQLGSAGSGGDACSGGGVDVR